MHLYFIVLNINCCILSCTLFISQRILQLLCIQFIKKIIYIYVDSDNLLFLQNPTRTHIGMASEAHAWKIICLPISTPTHTNTHTHTYIFVDCIVYLFFLVLFVYILIIFSMLYIYIRACVRVSTCVCIFPTYTSCV